MTKMKIVLVSCVAKKADIEDGKSYVLYTLRFAVPRVAAKQRDEVVYQIVHLAVPVGSASIATLDVILGLAEPSKV